MRETLVHIAGQISYKKGCLPKVLTHLKKWDNKEIIKLICKEIIDVHKSYERFSEKSVKEAESMIKKVLLGFVRANRSTIVNMFHVSRISHKGRRVLELTNNEIVDISRRRMYLFRYN